MTNNTPETFSSIKNVNLRTWNRCSMVWNLMADKGVQAVKDYVGQFTENDRGLISSMFAKIKKDGYDLTRAAINREVQEDAAKG